MTEFLYADGRRFDRIHRMGADIPFWLEQARRYGGPILELACGTGRLTLLLAQAGYRVTGVELQESMLAEARRKAAASVTAVDLVQGDMRSFDLGRLFAQVILPYNSLCHLLTLGDLEACLGCVHRHLEPGGRFIIDVLVPDPTVLLRGGGRYGFAEYDEPHADQWRRILITSSSHYASDTQINHLTLYRTGPDGMEQEAGSLKLRMYYPQELDALLGYNGFVLEHKYGDYAERPFGDGARKQLVVCRAAL